MGEVDGPEASASGDQAVPNIDHLDLVDPCTYTDAERLLAQVVISAARGRGTMFRGRLAECEVAAALGAGHPAVGTSPWDLRLLPPDRRTIEVKSTGSARKFSIGRKDRDVDLWVFVHVAKDPQEVRFSVATNDQIKAVRSSYPTDRRSPVMLSAHKVADW